MNNTLQTIACQDSLFRWVYLEEEKAHVWISGNAWRSIWPRHKDRIIREFSEQAGVPVESVIVIEEGDVYRGLTSTYPSQILDPVSEAADDIIMIENARQLESLDLEDLPEPIKILKIYGD